MRFIRNSALVLCVVPALAFAQPVAEIVSLKGQGDYSRTPNTGWAPAKVAQKLDANLWVRTQKDSKMDLAMVDQTNVTIGPNSTAQVKQPDTSAPKKSILDFQKGKARIETKTPTKTFAVGTPTGLAAIRGTEWLVEVDDDGRSVFTVIEGEVELSNDLGTLMVGQDEQGVLEKGKPPSKQRVQNARERVQWVSQFVVDPSAYAELRRGGAQERRYAAVVEALAAFDLDRARAALVQMNDTPVSYFLLADIALYRGEAREAADWLRRAQERFPSEPRTPGLLARAYLFADEMELAREAAATARTRFPDTLESQLYAGEVARLDGDARLARSALVRATRLAPEDWRAWHALGQLHSERSDPRRARRALERALQLSPKNAAVLGERGLVEANAYDLALARRLLGEALAAQPDAFATWAGLGVARIKSGDLQGALEAMRRATLLEPGYGRAHVYMAVVYWQQGRADDALAELKTASVHDPRDPLPYQFTAMIYSDLMRPGDAVVAAREALARQRYTKSLDAIANNLRGASNLGAPLAQLGLEAWALKNAHDSFDPLWAGSHLFLADRFGGKFVSNSELMQGFLSDPIAFGAPNRFQPLVTRPGNYGTLALRGARDSATELTEPLVNANGLVAEGRIAYFAEHAQLDFEPRDGSADDAAKSTTLGIGMRLRDDIGMFVYGNRLRVDSRTGFQGRSLFETFQVIRGPASRFDGGFLYRPGPDTQVWVKGGRGSEDSTLTGRDVIQGIGSFRSFRDRVFTTHPRRTDYAGRGLHRLATGVELSAAAERATYRSMDFLERDAFGRTTEAGTRLLESVLQDIRDKSESAEIAVRSPAASRLVGEVQLDYSRYDKTNDILVRRDFINQRVVLEDDHERSQWSPRAGLVWRGGEAFALRAAYQRWLRPASIGSLKSPSTAGIVLDDRYVLPGGRFERLRAQGEWHPTRDTLLTVFADRQEIDNLHSSLIGVLNNRPDSSNLERLRNRSFNALATLDRLEGFPELSKGELEEYGIAANALLTRRVSLFADGAWASSENTGAQPGKRLAFMPKRRYSVGGVCFTDRRMSLAVKATYRGERFRDEANTQALPAEWSGAVQGYWESADKRWSVEFIIASIGAKSADESVGIALNYRF